MNELQKFDNRNAYGFYEADYFNEDVVLDFMEDIEEDLYDVMEDLEDLEDELDELYLQIEEL